MKRTTDNMSSIKNLRSGYVNIHNPTIAMEVYGSDLSTPTFQIDNTASLTTINGDLAVNGTATFTHVDITEIKAPMIECASNNIADLVDIGFFGKYVSSGTKYRGAVFDADDSRFKIFNGNPTLPGTTVTDLNSYISGVNVNDLRVSDGAVATPTLTFISETNSGLYRANSGEIGMSIAGAKQSNWTVNGLGLTSGFSTYIREEKSATDYTLVGTDNVVMISTTNSIAVNIPSAAIYPGKSFTIIKTGATGLLTITRTGGDTFDGADTTIVLNTIHDKVKIASNGVDIWYSGV